VRLGQIEAGLQDHEEAAQGAPGNAELRVNHAHNLLLAAALKAA